MVRSAVECTYGLHSGLCYQTLLLALYSHLVHGMAYVHFISTLIVLHPQACGTACTWFSITCTWWPSQIKFMAKSLQISRPRDSSVWDYFLYNEESDKSILSAKYLFTRKETFAGKRTIEDIRLN